MHDFDDSLPTDLQWFMQATEIATAIEEDFDLGDLKYVESAWQIVDGDLKSFGWVVAMVDGRRLYLEYTIVDIEGQAPCAGAGIWLAPPRARSALEHRRTVLELLRTTQKPSFVRIERKARRQRPQAPGCISLGHRFHRQFFAFQTLVPFWRTYQAVRGLG